MCSRSACLNHKPVEIHGFFGSLVDVQHSVCFSLGILKSLQFRTSSTACQNLWVNFWAPHGPPLVALDAHRANHALAASFGIFDEPLPTLHPSLMRALSAAAMHQARHSSLDSSGPPTDRETSKHDATTDWLLHGCCRLQHVQGLLDKLWLLASGFTISGNLVLPPAPGLMLWPSANTTLSMLRRMPLVGRGASILELGAGCGQVGLALASRASSLVLTDCEPSCLEILRHNVLLARHSSATIEVCGPCWFGDVALPGRRGQDKFDLVIASDVLYPCQPPQTHKQLWATVDALLQAREETDASCETSDDTFNTGGSAPPGFLINFVRRDMGPEALLHEAACRGFEVRLLAEEEFADPHPDPDSVPRMLQCSLFFFTRRAH